MPQASPTPSAEAPLRCGNCGAPMRALMVQGHYGHAVEIDLCEPCHLVWFDAVESARIAGPALLEVIGAMAQAQSLPHQPLRPDVACPHCRAGVKQVHNRTRWGPSLQLECRSGHGAWQSFAEYLTEKGLVRPLSNIDRAQLMARDGRIDCVNCGAPIDAGDASCSHCLSVPSLFDVARLARALDPEDALDKSPVHAMPSSRAALQCLACGAALPPGQALQCATCGATLAVSRLATAHGHLQTLESALRAHRAQPSPEVVRARLEALSGDVPRRREWARKMQDEADARQGRLQDPDLTWSALRQWSPWQIALAALVLLLLWWI